jgi:hypothetical protein
MSIADSIRRCASFLGLDSLRPVTCFRGAEIAADANLLEEPV